VGVRAYVCVQQLWVGVTSGRRRRSCQLSYWWQGVNQAFDLA
jgi:hypothetical protein